MQLHQALTIANNIIAQLSHACTTIQVAGSIRREAPEVGDIEIICKPQLTGTSDLFGSIMASQRSQAFVKQVDALGRHIKGKALDGRYVQIALPAASSTGSCLHEPEQQTINLDLFIPAPHDYYRQLAIRTGSADYAHKTIAAGWIKQGWCGTPDGLRRQADCVLRNDKWLCVSPSPQYPPIWQSEEAFFAWLGIPYLHPTQRYIVPKYITN